jgi:hypothetical protein
MGIAVQTVEPHWTYLLALERDVERVSRFVEFDKRNWDCFSIEIARVLLAAGAESDVVANALCRHLNPKSEAENIHDYRDEIVPSCAKVPAFVVEIPRFGLQLTPWLEWGKKRGVPLWWTAYNKTKHERATNYEKANLKNMLNAVAGLYVLVLYLCKEKATRGQLLPSPQLLRPGVDHFGGMTMGDFELGITYSL